MKFNHFLIIGTVLISITNCKEKPEVKTGEIVSTIASGSQTDEEIKEEQKQIAIDEAKRIEDKKRNVTTLSFNRLEHDFGKVIEDTDNFTEFMVTNTGDKPLIISNVKASCGCTTPEKPEGPIAPGKSDKIKVKFHPNPGQLNEIQKTVTITANTDPVISTVTIKAFVVKK
ncbi:MAG: DUF1573 domain-containing protein [Flavobacteriales bacterium]|jgi:hypothetical protein|nr:DUF1573 domain-containing protein [Crocinitomicaceae bacterium]